jgi:hypothetical protein
MYPREDEPAPVDDVKEEHPNRLPAPLMVLWFLCGETGLVGLLIT